MLEIKNLSVTVDDKKILRDFSLNIEDGKIHAIMGRNGAGKSTICKVIMGEDNYQIVKGEIKYNGKNLKNLDTTSIARLNIFFLSQNPIAIEGVTNAEMLRTALSDKDKKQVNIFEFNKKLENICKRLDIPKSFIHKNINEGASGGERKKIELMHMWMLEPKLILLDELDSGLDVDALKIVANSLNEYYQEFKPSILIITHHAKIFKYIKCDYVHILKDGKIVETGDDTLADKIDKYGFEESNDTYE